jgi:AraC-like DNA-binding protein
MTANPSGSAAASLERSCEETGEGWIRQQEAAPGVTLLEAWFARGGYRPHRHDTYGIAVTEAGVQGFGYRGASYVCLPGDIIILHPDEVHDGYAEDDAGFGYRLLYVEPALIFAAMRTLAGHRAALPFVRRPVVRSAPLAAAIHSAFPQVQGQGHRPEPLAIDDLVLRLAEGLLTADPAQRPAPSPKHLDLAAIARARQFLDAEQTRVVRSWELEAVTGLTRYDLARQFRAVVGTSPYRYSLLRRLDGARAQLARHRPLADVALAAGFADQAHFTRMFSAAYGMSPGRYSELLAVGCWPLAHFDDGRREMEDG